VEPVLIATLILLYWFGLFDSLYKNKLEFTTQAHIVIFKALTEGLTGPDQVGPK
jgi:hypothetical protein